MKGPKRLGAPSDDCRSLSQLDADVDGSWVLGMLEDYAVGVASSATEPPEYIQTNFELHEEFVDVLDATTMDLTRAFIIRRDLNG